MAIGIETPDENFDADMNQHALTPPADENENIDSNIAVSKNTSFQEMYDFFLAGITDDMFMELTKEDTEAMLEEILLAALPHFEFPRWKDPFNLDLVCKEFSDKLTLEEKMILRQYMISEWIGFQLATVDLIRQKYSGSDFSFTSQASHMRQLIAMKQEYETKGYHLQRLYSRRGKTKDGYIHSTFGQIMQPISKNKIRGRV